MVSVELHCRETSFLCEISVIGGVVAWLLSEIYTRKFTSQNLIRLQYSYKHTLFFNEHYTCAWFTVHLVHHSLRQCISCVDMTTILLEVILVCVCVCVVAGHVVPLLEDDDPLFRVGHLRSLLYMCACIHTYICPWSSISTPGHAVDVQWIKL